MRTAQRLTPPATPSVRPAMPSRSPLAEADQRLNLDAFSARFDAPIVSSRTGLEPVMHAPGAVTDVARPVRTQPPARRPGTAILADELAPRAEHIPAQIAFSSEPSTPAPPSTRTAQPLTKPNPRDSELSSSHEAPSNPQDRRTADRSPRPVNPLPEPAIPQGPSPVSMRPRIAPAIRRAEEHIALSGDNLGLEPVIRGGERQQGREAGGASMEAVMHALHQVTSWVERGNRQPREAERVNGEPGERRTEASPAAQPSLGMTATEWLPRTVLRDTRPVTHLEIGKIEVEVVPPVKPTRSTARLRPSPKPTGASGGSTQPFGWRQR